MPTLNDFFQPPTQQPHPRLRAWERQLKDHNKATLEVFRPRGDFGPAQPQMYVHFSDNGQPDMVPWEDELNAGLIRLHVRATNPQVEAERFALGLRAALRSVEQESGDGYFNAVLVELIREGDLLQHPEIAEVMQHAHAVKPHRQGGAFDRYTVCHDLIADAIGGRARELTQDLGYPPEEAKPILVAALASYLDERFSVSRRRAFGLL